MLDEKTTSPAKGNVLRISLLDHLSSLLEPFSDQGTPGEPSSARHGSDHRLEDDDASGEGDSDASDRRRDDQAVRLAKRSVTDLDVGAWTAWGLVGLQLFSGGRLPELRVFMAAARSVLLIAAIERFDGNISRMAATLVISRRRLREMLKEAGLYAEHASSAEASADPEPPTDTESAIELTRE